MALADLRALARSRLTGTPRTPASTNGCSVAPDKQVAEIHPFAAGATPRTPRTPRTPENNGIENDAVPDEWEEAFAQLACAKAPINVPLRRWRQFIEDGGRFVREWGKTAAKLGWHSTDLFGADRLRPLARIDRAGLVWLLNGRRVTLLGPNGAKIQTSRPGETLTYVLRKRQSGEVVLPWELAGTGERR